MSIKTGDFILALGFVAVTAATLGYCGGMADARRHHCDGSPYRIEQGHIICQSLVDREGR